MLPLPGPKFVEWINDSSANVLFADAPTAKRAIAGTGKPLPPEEAPEQMGKRRRRRKHAGRQAGGGWA